MADPSGKKFDGGKRRYDLIPVEALGLIVDVLTFGAAKYEDENWRKVPNWRRRYYSALTRHLEAWRAGEWADPESGLPHLAHAGANCMFLLTLALKGRRKHGR